ncbi:MAG: ABC-type transport auxiliary lipoprotein family protein [Terriglobia bacterium]
MTNVESRSCVGKRLSNRRVRWLVLLALAAASCGSVPRTSYYTLRVPAPPESKDPRTSGVVGVEHFRATEALRDDRIVYYESPTQMNFYQYHRWSADPATMLSDLTARRLDESGAFAGVRRLPSRDAVDYVLRGSIMSFEEVDDSTGVRGRVAIQMSLVRARDRKTLWSQSRQAESAAQGKGVPAVVEALNAACARVLDELLPAVVAKVEQDARENANPSQ